MNIDFTNQIVIVSGATRGIGAAISNLFLQSNATVIATGTNIEQIEQLNLASGSDKQIYKHLDFTSASSVSAFLDYVKSQDRIDVLVNSAGVNSIDLIDHITDADWNWIDQVNLQGPFQLTREISAVMKQSGYGRIINIASIFGVVSKSKRAAYSTTKWGLIGFTKAVALDLALDNIMVNAVSPGFVDTELTRRILSTDEINELLKTVPVGRMASPEEIAQTVLFLSSSLNTYITGQNIIVDGGFTSA